MAETIKKHWDIVLIGGTGLTLAIAGLLLISGMVALPNTVSAVTQTQDIVVSATVNEWLTFSVSANSASLTPDLVDTSGNTAVASSSDITLDVGTNSTDGWTVWVHGTGDGGGNGGLYLAGVTDTLIETVSPTSTLTEADDDDGYGLNATTSLAGVDIKTNYDYWGTLTVGEIKGGSTNKTEVADKNSANSSQTVATIKFYAECDSAQDNGTYYDNPVTLSAVSSY